MTAADLAGWAGAAALVVAYAATSIGALRPAARAYQLLNLGGSVGLGAVAWTHRSWPSLALNALWLVVAAVALRRTFIAHTIATNKGETAWLLRQRSPRSSTSR